MVARFDIKAGYYQNGSRCVYISDVDTPLHVGIKNEAVIDSIVTHCPEGKSTAFFIGFRLAEESEVREYIRANLD